MQPIQHLKHFYLFTVFVVALLMLLVGGFCARELVLEPDIGALWSPRTGIVDYIALGSPAATQLQSGDRILKIDGVPFQESLFRFNKYQPGDSVRFDIERLGEVLIVDLFYTRYSMWFLNLLPIVSATAFWVVGVVVFAFKPTNKKAILFFLYCQMLSGVLATGGVGGYVWLRRLFTLLTWWVIPIGIHFHFLFPVAALTSRSRRVLMAVYLLAFLGTVLYIASGRPVQNRLPNELYDAYTAFRLCWLIGHPLFVIYLLLRAYRSTKSKEVRRQVGLVAFSGITALTPFLMFSLLPDALIGRVILPYRVIFLFFLAIPLGYGYAIFRFQFIRLERHINRSTTLFLVITLLCGLYLTANVLLRSLISADQPQFSIINLALVMLPVLAFSPLHRRLRLLTDHLFYGGWYDYPSVVGEITSTLQDSTNMSSLMQSLCETIQKAMRVYWVCLLLPDHTKALAISNQKIEVSWFEQVQLSPNSPIVHYLQTHNRPIASLELYEALNGADLSSDEVQWLTDEHTRLLIPIRARHGSLGVLILGPKYGGDRFDHHDFEILSVVAHQASMAFQNAQLIGELSARAQESSQYQRRALHAREQERKHVARELHDDIIQSLVGVKFQVYGLQDSLEASGNGQVVQLKEELGHLIGQTRRICRGLRPPALDLGLVPALRSLIHDMRSSSQLHIRLSVHGDQDQPLSEDIALSLFRFTQEALANVQKHARARQVTVRLELGSDEVSLRVKDDGGGFVVPERLGDLMKKNHFGLVGLRERLELVSGTLQINSTVGQGTRLCARIRRKPPTFGLAKSEEPDLAVALAPNTPFPIRVLIADDHAVVRRGVRHEIAQQLDMEVIGEAVDGRSTLHLVQAHKPTVLILDIHLPDMSGIEVMNHLTRSALGASLPHVLVLSAYNDREYVTSMIAAGAKGYLLKDSEPAQIARSVRQVVRGQLALSAPVLDQLYGNSEPISVELMPRERSVLQLMARGYTNAQIAKSLRIGADAVKNEETKIIKLLAVQTRAEAVSWAWQNRIVSLE